MSGRERAVVVAGRLAVVGLLVVGTVLSAADPFMFLLFAPYMAVGAVLAVLRPRNVVGWLLIAISFGFIGTSTPPDADMAALLRGDANARDSVVIWIESWAGLASYVGFLALTIVFPNGHLPDRGRRTSTILLVVGVAVVVLAAIAPTISITVDAGTSVVFPNPLPLLPDLPIWSDLPVQTATFPVVFVLLAIGVVRMVQRYRRATGIERLQLRWLGAAVAFVVIGVVVGIGAIVAFGDTVGGAGWFVVLLAYPTVPAAVGVAVMRYRLLEIDRIISRTIGWTLVTGVLVAVFAGAVIALQAVLSGFTQGQTLAVAASTLVAFALFQPARRRIQTAVDRRFDRTRYDGERVVASFSERLRHELDLRALAAEIDRVATETVRPTRSTVWLRPTSRDPSRRSTP